MRKHDEHQPDKEKKKHPILFTFLALILILALFVTINANRNIKAMNDCVDETLKTLRSSYTMTPVDVGDYEEMNIYGIMKFHVEQYDIEGLGNLSVMRMNMGLMQMATVVITPQDKNMPLLSADYMYILSNRQSYLEFYDVVSEKNDLYLELLDSLDKHLDQYAHLENIETSPAWYEHLLTVTAYKGGKPAADPDLQKMLTESIKIYVAHAKKLPALSDRERADKLAITVEYTDGLIEKGGISTDVFKDQLGDEETKRFFDNIFFGTARK